MEHLKTSTSCRANSEKMVKIQKDLEQRGHGEDLVSFFKKQFPFVIEELVGPKMVQSLPPRGNIITKDDKVFKNYNHELLTFPQRIIIESLDKDVLLEDVRQFSIGKVGVDYIIVDNRAYIEYFRLKYAPEARMVKSSDREIYQYRKKHGLVSDQRVV